MDIYVFGTQNSSKYFCSHSHSIDCLARYRITDLKSIFLQGFKSLLLRFIAFIVTLGKYKAILSLIFSFIYDSLLELLQEAYFLPLATLQSLYIKA